MKQTFRMMLVAAMAMLTVANAGCSKDESNNNNANNGGDGGGNVPAGWVDLGLPSGLLWAECNVGANAPEEYGDYYAWGETQPKDVYSWSTYRYCTVNGEGNVVTLTKYNTKNYYGTVDSLTTLEPVDDAATANIGNEARTPTKADWEELMNTTTAEWTTLNGVNGRKFTGPNGNSVFLPAAGFRIGSESRNAGYSGNYWSSSLNTTGDPANAWRFGFSSDEQNHFDLIRYRGLRVRAVRSR